MRLNPDTRDRGIKNKRPQPPQTHQANPGAQPPLAPVSHQQYNTYHTVETMTALQQAPCLNVPCAQMLWHHWESYLAIRNAIVSSEMRWNAVFASCPARKTLQIESADTKAATGGPDSTNGHNGAGCYKETRW